MKKRRIAMGACLGVVATLWAGSVVAGPGLDEKCQALKNNEAGKLAACLEKAQMKLVMTAGACAVTTATICYRDDDCPAVEDCNKDLTVYNTLIAACTNAFERKWQALETKFGAECPTAGDRADVQTTVETCTDTVSSLLAPIGCAHAGGTEVGGSCWFWGQFSQSCDAACAAAGRSYDLATRDYAGSGGTDAHCQEVLNALHAWTGSFSAGNYGAGMGCCWDDDMVMRARDTSPTVSSASDLWFRRACACQ